MTQAKVLRYGFIDSIRGIAACLVMLQHSLYESGILGTPEARNLTSVIFNWLELGETGVVSFFLVSGFVIPFTLERTSTFTLFWIHRALRIYPLYLTIFALTVFSRGGGEPKTVIVWFVNFASHILFLQEYLSQENFVAGSWTLSLELVWYIVIFCLFLVSLNKNTTAVVLLCVIVSSLAQLVCITSFHLPMGRLSMLLCCVLGLVCYRREQEAISARQFVALFGVLGLTIFINLYVGFKLSPALVPSATFLMVINSWVLAAIIFFVPLFTQNSTIWRYPALSFLGRISYSIYLLHGIVIYFLLKIPLFGIPLIIGTFAITILGSAFTYQVIELPPIRLGHSLHPRLKQTSNRRPSHV